MTPRQCRAARALLDWNQADLARRAGVGLSTLRNFERGATTLLRLHEVAVRDALEAAGVTFDLIDGEGEGVRMKTKEEPDA